MDGWKQARRTLVAVEKQVALLFSGHHGSQGEEGGVDEGRIISQVTRHETWIPVLVQVGDGK